MQAHGIASVLAELAAGPLLKQLNPVKDWLLLLLSQFSNYLAFP
jgi:hypothetical protein